jgi:urea carboxylase
MGLAESASSDDSTAPPTDAGNCPEGCVEVKSPLTANVWQIAAVEGTIVAVDERLAVLEAMKMEISIASPEAGTVEKVFIIPGRMVTPGQTLFWLRTA